MHKQYNVHPNHTPYNVYGVASASWIDKTIGVFSKEPYKRDYSAKETYNFIDPTNRSRPTS